MSKNTQGNYEQQLNPVENMMSAIKEKGGEFHFEVIFSVDGWTATCEEFPQIFTWGEGIASHDEITKATTDAIKAAFNIPDEMNSSFKMDKRDHPEKSYAPVPLKLQTTTELVLSNYL